MTTGATATARLRRWARTFAWPVRIAIIVVVVGLVAWRVDVGQLRAAFALHSWGMLSLAIVANFTSVVMTGVAWKGVVDRLPHVVRPTRFIDLLSPLMVGFLFNTILAARVGELVKVMLLRRRLARRGMSLRLTVLLGSVVTVNLITTIAWVAIVAVIGSVLPLPRAVWWATMGVGVACLAVVGVALVRRPKSHLPHWLSSRGETLWGRARRGFSRLYAAVHESHLALRSPRHTAILAVGSVGTWLCQWAGIYCTLRAFGLEFVGWGGAGLLLVTVTLAQIFPVLPGNLVIFQTAAVLPLTTTYGVGGPTAIAFSIVLQFTEFAVGVALGFCFLLLEGVGFSELRRQVEAEEAAGDLGVDTLGGV